MTREEFIRKHTRSAVDSTQNTGLFPSVKMAQAILESADKFGRVGQSQLAKKYNNFFGIKVPGKVKWTGKSVNLKTREVFNGEDEIITDAFRVYPSPGDSFRDHTNFLVSNPRYRLNRVFDSPTPEDQARALQRAEYATDPTYAEKLIGLIRKHNLKELDKKKM